MQGYVRYMVQATVSAQFYCNVEKLLTLTALSTWHI